MYDLCGIIKDISIDYQTGQPLITLAINQKQAAFHCFDELKNTKKLSIKIDKYRQKRSLNANAYMWLLCGKLAEKLSDTTKTKYTKESIYIEAIKEIGVFRQVEIDEKAVDTLIHSWGLHGLGWVAEKLDYSKNKGFILVNLYYGSSTYNQQQMARLIDNIVQDCQAVGIETKTPNEIANLISLWGEQPRKDNKNE